MDHKENAVNLLESIELDTGDVYEQTSAARQLRLELAQVHATLHLAEQQRIANLIAAADKWGGDELSWPLGIREGLDLT